MWLLHCQHNQRCCNWIKNVIPVSVFYVLLPDAWIHWLLNMGNLIFKMHLTCFRRFNKKPTVLFNVLNFKSNAFLLKSLVQLHLPSRRTPVAPLDLLWPGLLLHLTGEASPAYADLAGQRRPAWTSPVFFKYGGWLSISRCKKLKNVDYW